jgi:hypothetical protein
MNAMTLKKIISIICFFAFATNLYSFDCKGRDLISARYINLNQSDVIALCKVLEGKKLEIIQCFKGNFVQGEKTFFSTTLPLKNGDIWLIYAKNENANPSQLLIDECSISRNVQKPFLVKVIDYQPPSPSLFIENRLLFDEKSEAIRKQSFIDLSNEILWLSSQSNDVDLKKILKNSSDNRGSDNILVYILLFLVLVLQLLTFFKKHKHNP